MTSGSISNPGRRRLAAVAIAASLFVGGALAGCTAPDPGPVATKAADILGKVPFVSGDIVNEVTESGVRSAVVTVADAAAQETALQLLIDDGFEIIGDSVNGDRRSVVLRGDSVSASLVLDSRDGVFRVIYNITEDES